MNERTLLMTGTIKPFVEVTHNDPETRLLEYKQAIAQYITASSFDTIIFAENSGYQFDSSNLEDLAKKHGKKLIILSFVHSEAKNMSTGEGVLMKRVLEACPFLDDEKVIWKVTGRLWISNINKLLSKHRKKENLFLYSRPYDSVQTWFFCAKVADLKKYFLTNETIEAMSRNCIEYAWMDAFRKHKEITVERFKCYPNAIGVRSSGQAYTVSGMKRLLIEILLRLGYFTVRRSNRVIERDGL